MSHTIHVELIPQRGSLLRVLGLIERRGFVIERVEASSSESGAPSRAEIAVRGQKESEVLARQISRLLDVRNVRISPDQPTSANDR